VNDASEGCVILPGNVYVAPADFHVVINADGTLSLTHTPQVHFVRPSADVLFTSAATAFGPRTIAVVLSGMGRDGSSALLAVKDKGGIIICQDHASSEFTGMPDAAMLTGTVDYVLPLDAIAATLCTLVAGPVP
jgi:two-component system chemotaxis response regulator CheB